MLIQLLAICNKFVFVKMKARDSCVTYL